MNEYRLEQLFDLQMGKTPSRNESSYWLNGLHDWISIRDLSNSSKYISETNEKLSDIAVKESGIRIIPKDTVIMSFKLSIGKVAITSHDMYSNEAIMAFHDKKVVEILPEYLYYLLLAKNWDEGSNKAVMGITLNKATLSMIKIRMHDIVNQVQITSVLDNLDKQINNKKKQITEYDQLIKSRFVEMFGDIFTNEKSFKVGLFEDYVEQMNIGPFGSALKNEYFVSKEDSYCMVYEQKHAIRKDIDIDRRYVTFDKYKELQRFEIGPGDLIVSCRGTIGECHLLPKNAPMGIIHPSLMMIKPKKHVNGRFLLYLLEKILERQLDSGSGVKMAIQAKELAKVKTIIPEKNIQDDYVFFVEQVDKLKFEVLKLLGELR